MSNSGSRYPNLSIGWRRNAGSIRINNSLYNFQTSLQWRWAWSNKSITLPPSHLHNLSLFLSWILCFISFLIFMFLCTAGALQLFWLSLWYFYGRNCCLFHVEHVSQTLPRDLLCHVWPYLHFILLLRLWSLVAVWFIISFYSFDCYCQFFCSEFAFFDSNETIVNELWFVEQILSNGGLLRWKCAVWTLPKTFWKSLVVFHQIQSKQ